jgi:UDP-GlcNAc:undecaprenyl-phosphate GlcNAc-1-phosphate transferase
MQYFAIFLTALFSSTLLLALLIRLAYQLRFIDIPEPRKVHAIAIPRVGGIGMVLGTILALVLWFDIPFSINVYILGFVCLSLFGILDDRYNIHYIIKFIGQCIAVLIVVLYGNLLITNLSLFGYHTIPNVLAYPLTIIFLLGTTNAMNMSDGLDGLAAGLGILSLTCIAYLAMLADGHNTIALSCAIIGATLGFLRYNTYPAIAFMGDTGSQFLGYSIGILAISVTQEINTAISGVLPLFILGLPVVDTLRVIVERLLMKRSPFKPDRSHFHHKLLAMGLDHYESVLIVYIIQAIFIFIAVIIRYYSDILVLSTYMFMIITIYAIIPIANKYKWYRKTSINNKISITIIGVDCVLWAEWIEIISYLFLSTILSTLIFLGAILNLQPKEDFGYLSGVILLTWIIAILTKSSALSLISRIVMYFCATLTIYSFGSDEIMHPEIEYYFRYAVVIIAVVVAICLVLSPRYFIITPSDILIMFILIASACLHIFGTINYAKLATEGAIILYALEYILRRPGVGINILTIGCLAILVMTTLQSFLYL